MLYAIVPLPDPLTSNEVDTNTDRALALKNKIDLLGKPEAESIFPKKMRDLLISTYKATCPNVFFVVYYGTAQELFERIGFGEDGELGLGIVIGINSYYAYATRDLLKWLEKGTNGYE